MNEFILIFRNVPLEVKPSPEELQNISKPWIEWMQSLAEQGKLVNQGNRLGFDGATVKPKNVIMDGPYAELKEIVAGFTIIRAANLAEAIEIAKNCPILNVEGSVEVRSIVTMVN